MQRLTALLALLAAAAFSCAGAATTEELLAQARGQGTVRVIVELRAGTGPARPARIGAAREELLGRVRARVAGGLRVARAYRQLPFVTLELDARALAAAADDPAVAALHPDRLAAPSLPESTVLIGADTRASQGFGGSGQTVAVLDSGVDAGHPFFGGRVLREACFSSTVPVLGASSVCPGGAETRIGPGSGVPCLVAGCTHGTHVAGIAAGEIGARSFSGVAPAASLLSIQVFTRFDGSVCTDFGIASPCILSFTSDQLAALEHVLEQLPDLAVGAVNMSLSGGRFTSNCDSDPLKPAVDALRAAGTATVVAAGNSGFLDAVGAPACISSTVSVGSTTKGDAVSFFSNRAPFLDLLAPGSAITSSLPGGLFGVLSGTSMAAPHVAGSFAAVRSGAPKATVDDILNALRATGVAITDADSGLLLPRVQVDLAVAELGLAAGQGELAVSPSDGLLVLGPSGGPFVPSEMSYLVSNPGSAALAFSVASSAAWLRPSPSSGTLGAGESVTVLVTVEDDAAPAAPGDFVATLSFTNLSNGVGNTSRAAQLVVVPGLTVNDKFDRAIELVRSSGSTAGTNTDATKETGEPDHAGKLGGRSAWWRWAPPASGSATFDTAGSSFDTLLAVYTGERVAALTEIASDDDALAPTSRVQFDAVAGVVYRIAVDGIGGAGGDVALNWTFQPESVSQGALAVTPEAELRPEGAAGGPFAPASQLYTVSNVSAVTQSLTVTSLPTWLQASQAAASLDPGQSTTVRLTVTAAANALLPGEYRAAVRFNDIERSVRLNIAAKAPPNDTFAQALVLEGIAAGAEGFSVGAGKEPGEPEHAGNRGGRSVWWRWQATHASPVTIDTAGSGFDTLLAVYSGGAVDGLTEVASSDDADGTSSSRVSFRPVPGVTYRIAVDGFHGASGPIALRLRTDAASALPLILLRALE